MPTPGCDAVQPQPLFGNFVSAAAVVAAVVDAGAAAFAAALEMGRSVAWSVDPAVVFSKPIVSLAVVVVIGAAICFAEVSAWGLQPIYQMSWFAIVLVVWKLWFALVVFGV